MPNIEVKSYRLLIISNNQLMRAALGRWRPWHHHFAYICVLTFGFDWWCQGRHQPSTALIDWLLQWEKSIVISGQLNQSEEQEPVYTAEKWITTQITSTISFLDLPLLRLLPISVQQTLTMHLHHGPMGRNHFCYALKPHSWRGDVCLLYVLFSRDFMMIHLCSNNSYSNSLTLLCHW